MPVLCHMNGKPLLVFELKIFTLLLAFLHFRVTIINVNTSAIEKYMLFLGIATIKINARIIKVKISDYLALTHISFCSHMTYLFMYVYVFISACHFAVESFFKSLS